MYLAHIIMESEKSKIYSQHTENPGEQMREFQYESKSKDRRRLILHLKDSQAEREDSFFLSLLFCSGFSGLDEIHSHWGRQSALLSLPI